jgi:hypothetical protein
MHDEGRQPVQRAEGMGLYMIRSSKDLKQLEENAITPHGRRKEL